MTADEMISAINDATSRDIMTAREAIEFLDEVGAHIDSYLDALRAEEEREK